MSGLERTGERTGLLTSQGTAEGIGFDFRISDDPQTMQAQLERIEQLFRERQMSQAQYEDLKAKAVEKIDELLARGERLEVLKPPGEDLNFSAVKFRDQAHVLQAETRRRNWCLCCLPLSWFMRK